VGRVQRFQAARAVPQYPSGAFDLGALYLRHTGCGRCGKMDHVGGCMRLDLFPLGINVDCLPVLDVPSPRRA